jgi:GNAT superfamily N-acetyltransferase
MIVREFDRNADFDGMRACLIELQEFERRIDPRKPTEDEIATAYISDALSKCAECHGKIFVADEEDEIAGYATVLARVHSGTLDDGDLEYAYLADLVVRATYRGLGMGRELIAKAETYARGEGAKWLRVCVLAENQGARRLYHASGNSELYVDFEKDLTARAGVQGAADGQKHQEA